MAMHPSSILPRVSSVASFFTNLHTPAAMAAKRLLRGLTIILLPVMLAVVALFVFAGTEAMPPVPPPEPSGLYPGDHVVPAAVMVYDQTKLINATPADVWPWVQQVGKGRGGRSLLIPSPFDRQRQRPHTFS